MIWIVSFYRIGIIPSARTTARFRVIRADTITRTTMTPSVFCVMRVVFVEWMSAYAMSLCRVAPSKCINYSRDGFKMCRVKATASSTQVVNNKRVRQSPNKDFINNTMNLRSFIASQIKSAIPFLVQVACKQPARSSVPSSSRIDDYLTKNTGKKFSIGRKFVRVISEHLTSVTGYDGLGFRGLTHREALSF